jgi:uncharacterized cofD-like protein
MLRVVGFGGGTGLPVLLKALRTIPEIEATAIVTVTDNGGSSGRLCQTFGIPAVGDLRNCLVALSGADSVLADLFQHRFSAADGLGGHSLGNLIVTAMCQRTGSLDLAVEMMSRLLPLKGRALPATGSHATLCAAFTDGTTVRGESQISAAGRRIARIWLEPGNPPPSPGVIHAIQQADTIIFAPGSLYTSILPNLLVAGVADAVRASRAVKIFVCNLMTQPGETDGYAASDHVRALEGYLGRGIVQFCIANSSTQAARGGSRNPGSEPVLCDSERIAAIGPIPVEEDLALPQATGTHHDPEALGRLVWEISRGRLSQTVYRRQPERAVCEFAEKPREAVCLNQCTPS